MSVVRLKPASAPEPTVSAHDQILSALNLAITDQLTDEEHKATARGVIVIWHHQDGDGLFGPTYRVAGLNTLETLGLLKMAGDDIGEYGLGAAPGNLSPEDQVS